MNEQSVLIIIISTITISYSLFYLFLLFLILYFCYFCYFIGFGFAVGIGGLSSAYSFSSSTISGSTAGKENHKNSMLFLFYAQEHGINFL